MTKFPWNGRQVLVIGGAGNLGGHIIQILLSRGAKVRSFDLLPYDGPDSSDVEIYQGDICALEDVNGAVSGAEVVFHTASAIDIRPVPGETLRRVNVTGTRNVIEACCRASAPTTLVYTSSLEVVSGYDASGRLYRIHDADETHPIPYRHTLPYASTKAQAEALVLEANNGRALRACSLRSGYIVGENAVGLKIEILKSMRNGGRYVTARVPAKLSSVSVRNCALGHILAAERCSAGVEAVAGEAFFLKDFDENVIDMNVIGFSGTPVKIVMLPLFIAWTLCYMMDRFGRLMHWLAGASFGLFTWESPSELVSIEALNMGWKDVVVSNAKARSVLGYGDPAVASWQSKEKCLEEMKDWASRFHCHLSYTEAQKMKMESRK